VHELTRQFQTLAGNILYAQDIDDKSKALRDLVDDLDARLSDAVENGAQDKSLLSVVKERLGLGKPAKKKDTSADPKPAAKSGKNTGLFIWKEAERYRWLAVYSNKYRDADRPPEILSEQAHETFIQEVQKGLVPYPDLWHWHVPGTRWGKADWLAYDKSTGFSLASGWIDPGHEKEAETMAGLDLDVRVSHGMPEASIERDRKDRTVITHYRSLEISDLPGFAAANPLTSFNVLKEGDAMIPDEKLAYLKMVGLSDEQITALQADLDGKAKEAQAKGLEFKETESTAPEPKPEEPKPAEEPKPEEDTKPLTAEDVAKAVTAVVAPILARQDAIETSLKALSKPVEEQVREKAADTPAASLSALILQGLSIRGKEQAKTDDKTVGPKETTPAATGIPFLDGLMKPVK
jgi:hypothetical protein